MDEDEIEDLIQEKLDENIWLDLVKCFIIGGIVGFILFILQRVF